MALATLASAGPAAAGKGQFSIFQHDELLRGADDQRRASTLDELDRIGVDIVKVLVSWRSVAPAGESKPQGFNGKDPAAYGDAWARYDDLVRGVQARGMRVMFALGGQAPDWAASGPEEEPGTGSPNPAEFRDFVQAVGTRYSGSYAVGGTSGRPAPTPAPAPEPAPDTLPPLPVPAGASQTVDGAVASATGDGGDAGGGGPSGTAAQGAAALPRVAIWSVWNEPNLMSWLSPQRRGGVAFAPHHYRRLLNGASQGLSASGHSKDRLLIGELLPFGAGNRRIRPLEFLRELACVDRRFRPYKGRAARRRNCQRFKALPGSGLAIHPYTPGGGPGVRMKHPDDISIAYLARITRTLDRLSARKRLSRRRMPVWITEFGFQSDPPDIFQTPIGRIPGYMGLSEWISYRNKRVASHAQYLLIDDKAQGSGFARYSGFQTGLRFANGRAKPGVYTAYRRPFFVRLISRSRVELFGAVRSAGKGRTVTIESRRGSRWRKLTSAKTVSRGYFNKTVRVASAGSRVYRFRIGRSASVELAGVRR